MLPAHRHQYNYLVGVIFGTAIAISFFIFGKFFSYLFVCFFVVPQYHTCTGGCCALQVKPPSLVGMYDNIIMFVEAQNFDFSYSVRKYLWLGKRIGKT